MLAVIDFGSQYTQLIAKSLRSQGFATQVYSALAAAETVLATKPKGIIFSGSPLSVGSKYDPKEEYYSCGVPLLGLCFGYQNIAKHFNGKVEEASRREYGPAAVKIEKTNDPLLDGVAEKFRAWMSHGDSVTQLPDGAELLLSSSGHTAGFVIPDKHIWALQFHPEVSHTEHGDIIFKNFAKNICGLEHDWDLKHELDVLLDELKADLTPDDRVVCAVSGGVDSTVMAVLLSQVCHVHAVYVDHGFQRDYDLKDLKNTFSHYPNIELDVLEVQDNFWAELKGISDPEEKRKIIGRLFIETFANHIKGQTFKYFGQGTIYSDVIESAANKLAPAEKIKSHHNVGALPDQLPFELIEPLRKFFKDEVRQLGLLLKIPEISIWRHPFPGPGLAVRCVGELQPEKIELIKAADNIFHNELHARDLYKKTWQALVALLPMQSVGVMGDGRTYESAVALRAVCSVDAMTAEATELPIEDLKAIGNRIVNEVQGINRVFFDLTSKPPGTIEYE